MKRNLIVFMVIFVLGWTYIHGEIISGTISNWNEGGPLQTIGDGTNHVTLWWSWNTIDKGWFYGRGPAESDSDVAFAPNITEISQIWNASIFSFTDLSVGPACDKDCDPDGVGDFIIWRNIYTGHYGVLRIDDIYIPPGGNYEDAELDGTWWFQTDGTGNFSSLVVTIIGGPDFFVEQSIPTDPNIITIPAGDKEPLVIRAILTNNGEQAFIGIPSSTLFTKAPGDSFFLWGYTGIVNGEEVNEGDGLRDVQACNPFLGGFILEPGESREFVLHVIYGMHCNVCANLPGPALEPATCDEVLHLLDSTLDIRIGVINDGVICSDPAAPPEIRLPASGPFPLTVTVTCECQLNVDEQNQYGMWYSGEQYDHLTHVNDTIERWGSALTSLSMALDFAGHDTDPHDLNNWMIQPENAGYSPEGFVRWAITTSGKTENNLTFEPFRSESIDGLRDILCDPGYPVIVGVNLRPDGSPRHFVLVTGTEGDRLRISDPGRREHRYLDQYSSFEARGYVSSISQQSGLLMATANDSSKIYFDVGDTVDLLIEDAHGNRTGFDQEIDQIVEEISQSYYFRDSIADDVSGVVDLGRLNWVVILQPSSGLYRVFITGIRSGKYELFTQSVTEDGSSQNIQLSGVADEGSISTFDIQYDSTPGSPVYVTRVASFESTLEDIENCYELGEIDNKGIANSLKKKIENAAKKADKGNTQASKNILNAFKNEVKAQKLKHISEMAVQILLEDADYLIRQLQ